MASIGSDVVRGLWSGISNMVGWVTSKIQGFGSNVLSGIKNFFGIHSPSRVFRDEVGKMLAAGLAEGIEQNAAEPMTAMADLSRDVLGEADAMNGLTIQRKLQNTFAAPEAMSLADTGMLDKLDKILAAIQAGQILTIDGKRLVGGTYDQMDSTLGQRRMLVERGAV
jgi:phage-related protein